MTKTVALSLVLAASLGLAACSKPAAENAMNETSNMADNASMAAENTMNAAMNAGGNMMDAGSNAMNATNAM